VLELRKRFIDGVSALLLRRIDELVEMTTIENTDAIFAAGVLLVGVA
jgi:predicted ATPase with chaperone activity